MSVDGQYLLFRTRAFDIGSPKSPKTKSTFYTANLTTFFQTVDGGGGSGVTERLQLVPVVTKRSTAFVVCKIY